jgi:hypothetical protein
MIQSMTKPNLGFARGANVHQCKFWLGSTAQPWTQHQTCAIGFQWSVAIQHQDDVLFG